MIIHATGGPEAIVKELCSFGPPASDEVLIETEAVGLNFFDVYFRTGLYHSPLPFTLGSESVARVVAMGSDVDGLSIGDQVDCVQGNGAYASHRIIKAAQAVRDP